MMLSNTIKTRQSLLHRHEKPPAGWQLRESAVDAGDHAVQVGQGIGGAGSVLMATASGGAGWAG
jgi:hypothetical protein